MRSLKRTALVALPPEQMFAVINDIERYPDFVQGCESACVERQGEGWVDASLVLRRGPIRLQFATHNRLQPPERIEMTLREGPFKQLHGLWTLLPIPLPQQADSPAGSGDSAMGCSVELKLDYELTGGWQALALSAAVERIADVLVESFVKRAQSLKRRTMV